MREEITRRIRTEATHILKTHDTIRKTAQIFGYSKSTVHFDVSVRLKKLDGDLYMRTKKILDENFAEKHIRGGQATKQKYLESELER